MILLQHTSQSLQVTSRVRCVMSTLYEVTWGVCYTLATCPMLLQGIWTQSRMAVLLFCSTFSSCWFTLLLCWKTADTVFVVLSFNFQIWRYSHTVAMSLLSSLPLPASLPQHAWLLGRMHTFWKQWLASQGCRCWRSLTVQSSGCPLRFWNSPLAIFLAMTSFRSAAVCSPKIFVFCEVS